MIRSERDAFVATTDQSDLAYGESACLETPPELFAALHEEFHFDVDLTANDQNHLLPVWLGPGSMYGQDALDFVWQWEGGGTFPKRKSGFSNSPYGDFVYDILPKAVEEMHKGFLSVFLLPLRINAWFKDIVMVHADEIRLVDERIAFWYQGKPKPTARVPWAKKYANDPRYFMCEGYVWHTSPHTPLLKPAGALFDSIIVVFRPKRFDPLHVGPKLSLWHWDTSRPCMLRRG